jgi:hypothetical protein
MRLARGTASVVSVSRLDVGGSRAPACPPASFTDPHSPRFGQPRLRETRARICSNDHPTCQAWPWHQVSRCSEHRAVRLSVVRTSLSAESLQITTEDTLRGVKRSDYDVAIIGAERLLSRSPVRDLLDRERAVSKTDSSPHGQNRAANGRAGLVDESDGDRQKRHYIRMEACQAPRKLS